MNEQDKAQMAEYGITSTIKMVYFYKEYRYDRLADALSYARSDTKRTEKGVKTRHAEVAGGNRLRVR